MHSISISEANKNFSAAANAANTHGIIAINKWGETQYYLMTKEEYDRIFVKHFLGTDGNAVVSVRKSKDRITIMKVDPSLDRDGYYRLYDLPFEAVSLEEDGEQICIKFSYADYLKNGGKEPVSITGGALDLSFSLEEIEQSLDMTYAHDRKRFDELSEARQILEKEEEAKKKKISVDISIE